MTKQKENKTNAMRILDNVGVSYSHYTYACGAFVDGMQMVEKLGLDPKKVYKTLVTQNPQGEHFVFVVPVEKELDLKKAARTVGQKSLAMIPVKDICKVTGYVRGGCTAVGMKKQYRTVIDSSALELETMVVSGGRIGLQLELAPDGLAKAAGAGFAEIT